MIHSLPPDSKPLNPLILTWETFNPYRIHTVQQPFLGKTLQLFLHGKIIAIHNIGEKLKTKHSNKEDKAHPTSSMNRSRALQGFLVPRGHIVNI